MDETLIQTLLSEGLITEAAEEDWWKGRWQQWQKRKLPEQRTDGLTISLPMTRHTADSLAGW